MQIRCCAIKYAWICIHFKNRTLHESWMDNQVHVLL